MALRKIIGHSERWILTRNVVVRWVLYTLLGFALLAVDPFGIGNFAEEGSQRVLYEIGGPLYDDSAREDIVIVLVTEQSLKGLYERRVTQTNEWPLLYRDWSVLLKTIAAHRPRTIFFDVYFEQERVTDSSLPRLLSTLDRFDGHLPIYFAGGIAPYSSELLGRLDKSSGIVGSAWQSDGNGVPLRQNGEPIAALRLYDDACGPTKEPLRGCREGSGWVRDEGQTHFPMSIVWGSRGALPLTAQLEGYSEANYCNNNTDNLTDLAFSIVKGALGEIWDWWSDGSTDAGVKCLFHKVIDADELMLVFDHGSIEEKSALMDTLQNKIVLVGTFFEGLPDIAESPTIGVVPGVALHAMMLDNLMKFGPDYIRTSGLNSVPYNVAVWSFVALVLAIWISGREYASARGKVKSMIRVPFIGRDASWFLLVSMALTLIAALSTFYFLRFEPANAIGFLGLAEIIRRIYGNLN